jgi:ribosomal protein L30/L7E
VNKKLTRSTVGFVVQINAANEASKDIQKELRKLGLKKKFDAVFINLTEEVFRKCSLQYSVNDDI